LIPSPFLKRDIGQTSWFENLCEMPIQLRILCAIWNMRHKESAKDKCLSLGLGSRRQLTMEYLTAKIFDHFQPKKIHLSQRPDQTPVQRQEALIL
jgi:hypothetical protein